MRKDQPNIIRGEADGLSGAGAASGELAAASDGLSAADLNSGEVAVSAGGLSGVGIVSEELSASQVELGECFSSETSSGELDRVCSRPKGEGAFYLSTSSTGFMPLGAKEGNVGGLCLDFVPGQPRLVESPLKALCAAPGVRNFLEEELTLSNPGLGEEESSPIPLMSIIPFGLSLSAENSGNEAVGCESALDTSKWVKNRLPSFSKLVGLSLNRHEKLCIDLLQRIEKEMLDAKAMIKKDNPTRKVVIFKDKGKRELRNLLSSVNYDGRK